MVSDANTLEYTGSAKEKRRVSASAVHKITLVMKEVSRVVPVTNRPNLIREELFYDQSLRSINLHLALFEGHSLRRVHCDDI